MTLRELLIEKQNALCARWLDAVLGEYGALTATQWRREKNRFANPVGHALSTGLPEIFEAAVGEGEPSAGALAALEAIVRIRSVQDLAPSRAVGFLYKLRDAIRDELGAELGAHTTGLAELDARIQQLTLLAFDTYVRLREQVFRLRQDELKRSVASLLRRWHGDEIPEPDSETVQLSPPANNGVRR
jgi:hypothetical protein